MHIQSGSDNDHRVGIMTENPQYTFDVSGSARITSSFYLPGVTSSPYNNVLIIDTGSGQVYVTASNAIGGGGSGTPGGSLRSIQFNSASIFSGSNNFSFDETTNSVYITGSLTISGSSTFTNIGPTILSGSVTSTQGFTGSMFGSASYVTGSVFDISNPALSASYALTASYVASATSFPFTGNAIITGSLIVSGSDNGFGGITGSLFGTASYVTGSIFTDTNPALSSSYALTASYAQTYLYNSTSSLLGDDINNIYFINHGFNTRNLHITVYENFDDYETVYPDVKRPHPDTASITFANPVLSTKQYMVYISI
jgi:hypothetical protein